MNAIRDDRVAGRMLTWLVLWTLWGPVQAWALAADVEAGRTAFQRGEFQTALLRFAQAERASVLPEEDLIELYWYRAAAHHALGMENDENTAHGMLLKLRPFYEPDVLATAPDLRAHFRTRQQQYALTNPVKLSAPAITAGALLVAVSGDAGAVTRVAAFARVPGQGAFQRFEGPTVDGTARIPVSDLALWRSAASSGSLELVLEALTSRGVTMARVGDPQRGELLSVTPADAAAAETAWTVATGPSGRASPAATPAQPAPEPASSSLPLRPMGGGLAALGGVAGVVALLAGSATLAAGITSGVLLSNLTRVGAERDPNRAATLGIYRAALLGGVGLGPLAVIAVLLALGGLAAGAALLVASVAM